MVDFFKDYLTKVNSEMAQLNSEYREKTGKEPAYLFQNFACEGKVLYFLDAHGLASKNSVFKLKPDDFSLDSHG